MIKLSIIFNTIPLITILMQLSAAFYALWLIRITGFKTFWVFISGALILMAVRRVVPFYFPFSDGSSPLYYELAGFLTSLLMLLGIFGIKNVFIERKNAVDSLSLQLHEKVVLLKEVHHRIKNNISAIETTLKMQMSSTKNQEVIAALQDAVCRVESMKLIYEKLLLSDEYQDIPTGRYFEDIILAVVSIYPDKNNISIDKEIEDILLDVKVLFPLGIIVNELLTNIMKYAFINQNQGMITIKFFKKNHQLNLILHDNGQGLPEGFELEKSRGFGLMLINMLTRQLNGTLKMENLQGTRCTLKVPTED